MPSRAGRGKRTAALPGSAKKEISKDEGSSMFEAKKKSFSIGSLQPRRDLSRFVKWPRYIRLQRQRRILKMRLKVPPAIAQFGNTCDVKEASDVLKLLNKYQPEEKQAKKARLTESATSGNVGKKPNYVKSGLNHVTKLIETKRAKLVVIAHDVDPIETIVWLPAMCRMYDIPYCIVKSKARLGTVVHRKTATCLAITDVNSEDKQTLAKISEQCKNNFNERVTELSRTWGGGIMGLKNQKRMQKIRIAQARDAAKKAAL